MVRKSGRNSSKSSETKSDTPKRTRSGRGSRRRKVSSSESEDEAQETHEIKETTVNACDQEELDNEKKSHESKRKHSRSSVTKQDDESRLRTKSENKDGCEDEAETEEKKHKGKSKTKSNMESSSQIERVIEHENVQVTPSSPPNDNADNESVIKNVKEIANDNQTEDNVVENSSQDTSDQKPYVVDENSSVIVNESKEQEAEAQVEVTSGEVVEIFATDIAVEQIEQTGPVVANNNAEERSHTPPPIKKNEESESHTPEKTEVKSEVRKSTTPDREQEKTESESYSHTHKSSNNSEDSKKDVPQKTESNRSSGKRISLRRSYNEVKPVDEKEVKESDKSATRKKITLKRSQNSSSISAEEKMEERNSSTDNTVVKTENDDSVVQKDEESWCSNYENNTNQKEDEQKTEKASRRISLKRKSVADEHKNSSISIKEKPEEPKLFIQDHVERLRRLSSTSEKSLEITGLPQKPFRKIKIIRNLSLDNNAEQACAEGEVAEKQPKIRKFRWVSESSVPIQKVDLELLKTVCPNLQFVSENEVDLSSTPPRPRRISENVLNFAEPKNEPESEEESEKSYADEQKSEEEEVNEQIKIETNQSIIALNRKISIVDDTASKMGPPPSPAKNPISDVLFITNLVRPFTVKQLKELLERTGRIKEDGFWTDRIKSKCYVHYESPEEAEATRNALHGVSWPIGNGKKLVIDYATVEDMEKARNPPVTIPVKIERERTPEKENRKPDLVGNKETRHIEDKKQGHVREWDAGKEDFHRRRSRSRSRSKERIRKHSRRSYTPEDYHSKKRRYDEIIPQKLMDDLFLKTKATPSIYWQPLSPEEIAMKQQQRLVRMEEHKRRLEENRTRREVPMRGVPFRRR